MRASSAAATAPLAYDRVKKLSYWDRNDKRMNAVSVAFVGAAFIIFAVLIVAMVDKFIRAHPNLFRCCWRLLMRTQVPSRVSSPLTAASSGKTEQTTVAVPHRGISVLMPGEDVPTHIAIRS